ncbi:MAG TPA: NUDIX domain-containing protein [Candidatus Paceibacterota bacterium]|nr:NUDIX domain-containing protein [Candidatus Paceibacterota bacterium]
MGTDSVNGVRIIPIYEGKCLFHLRDNNPNISHPNKWSFVSGSIEDGESFEEAIRRECKEEIGIVPHDLRYLGHSDVSACFYAYLSDIEAKNLVLGEGQEIRFFDPTEMSGLNMTPKLHELVTVYRDNLDKLIQRESMSAQDFGLVE